MEVFGNRRTVNVAEVEMLQVRRNLSERSSVLGLNRVDCCVVGDLGTARRWHDAIAMS